MRRGERAAPSGAGRGARCAMETHNVRADRLSAPMTAEDYKEFVPAGRFQRSLITALPFFALALAYAATQLAAFLKARPGSSRARRQPALGAGPLAAHRPWPALACGPRSRLPPPRGANPARACAYSPRRPAQRRALPGRVADARLLLP